AQGHAVKPARYGPLVRDRRRLAGQDEESRLESVLGILMMVQLVPDDIPHQLAMPLHKGGKGILVPVADVKAQQFAVTELADPLRGDAAPDMLQDRVQSLVGHVATAPGRKRFHIYSCLAS